MPDVAFVTGANRGIGLEVTRQLARRGMAVILGSRSLQKGERAAEELKYEGLEVIPRQLDVSDDESVKNLAGNVESEFGRLDVLVNNAAIHYDTWQRTLGADPEERAWPDRQRLERGGISVAHLGCGRTGIHRLQGVPERRHAHAGRRVERQRDTR